MEELFFVEATKFNVLRCLYLVREKNKREINNKYDKLYEKIE